MSTVLVYDATHAGASQIPSGQAAAGYTTGQGDVPWTAADWQAHPGAVRICQDPGATDRTADILDVESGAATIADCAPWAKAALTAYRAGTRPGQRSPAIYTSRGMVTMVVNALITGGVLAGIGLWIADWNQDQAQAAAEVDGASGPFPVIGRQFRNAAAYDISVFSRAWLDTVSGQPVPQPPQEGKMATYSGQLEPAAKTGVPVVKSTVNRLCLYADFTSTDTPLEVRVAIYSEAGGYTQIVDAVVLDDSKPHYVMFTAKDVTAVSFQRNDTSTARDVGYFITG